VSTPITFLPNPDNTILKFAHPGEIAAYGRSRRERKARQRGRAKAEHTWRLNDELLHKRPASDNLGGWLSKAAAADVGGAAGVLGG
jgi:hypothetical protein